jgi:hypothetical protein
MASGWETGGDPEQVELAVAGHDDSDLRSESRALT